MDLILFKDLGAILYRIFCRRNTRFPGYPILYTYSKSF